MSKVAFRKRRQIEEEILQLIDARDDMTRSDLQGAVEALVIKLVPEEQSFESRLDEFRAERARLHA